MRRCVIFDLDGTLTASDEGILNCVRHTAQVMGLPLPTSEMEQKMIGPPLLWSFTQLLGMTQQQALKGIEVYRERYNRVGLFENRVYPGIRTLLRMLKMQGDWVAIATGKPTGASRRIIEHFQLNEYFDCIEGLRDDDPPGKEGLISRILPPDCSEALMVGDRKYDIDGGRKAGCRTVGVGFGYGTEQELREAGCDLYAPTVDALIELLCPGMARPLGAFLSMEGLDGSGKTTQMHLLTEALTRYGYEVITSREPGGCPISEKIRQIILDPENSEMEPVTEALLYAAARAQHVREVIQPAVAAGKVLLSDRFVDSSIAYQGGGRELGTEQVASLNAVALDGTLPLCTVYLNIRHEEALRRRYAASQPDRLEREADSFHARVEAAYHQLIQSAPERFVVVDASLSEEEISTRCAEQVLARLHAQEVAADG